MSSVLPESIQGTEHFVALNSVENFLASLYANPQVPRNVVQTVVKDMKNIFNGIHQTLKNSTIKLLSEGNISNESFNHFNNILEVLEEPFTDLGTEYKRIKYFTDLGTYIAPCEYVIDTLEYVDKLKVHSSILINFVQFSVWKKKEKNHGTQIVFPIFLFFDDYEVGNALGSHSGIHKLGAGVHSITGFVESFSSNYPCRICKMRKEDIQNQSSVDNNLIRTVEQYNLDVNEGDVSSSGIKEACIWHKVLGFNVLEQVGMDIMHDILEGVGKYDLAFLISYYIEDLKIFTLQVLNERIVCFDYGPDKGSKPCVLHIEHLRKKNIRLSASEMMSLIRYFGLLIGYLVPLNDPIWCLYILLRQILDIVTSTSLQVGPLVNLWCMRFEAKHRLSKISANTSSNRRNICKTLAIKHQLQLNNLFLKGTLGDDIESGPSKKIISNTDIKKIKEFMEIDSFESLKQCTWICIKGIKYQSKMVLTLDIDENNLPKFASTTKVIG
eukprot:XP_008181629.1 PREDICTED: uncharacterized protein LOC103308990 [Acyrthosiphon pisum]